MRLIDDLLNKVCTLYIDNLYTSVPFAEKLLGRDTFICGTVKQIENFYHMIKILNKKEETCFAQKTAKA
jgi:hypothetical protein